MPVIRPLTSASFQILMPDLPDGLTVDFQPFIDTYDLSGSFVLAHWLAMPKLPNRRHFAFFSSHDGKTSYRIVEHWNLLQSLSLIEFLQIDETQYATLPSASILFQDSVLTDRGDGMHYIEPTDRDDVRRFIDNPPPVARRLHRTPLLPVLGAVDDESDLII